MSALKVVVVLCAATLVTAAPTAHVISIIGQSNSIGFNSGGHTPEDVSNPSILQTSCCDNGNTNNEQCRLIEAQDPLHHQCDSGYVNSQNIGLGMSFARKLLAEIPQGDIIILVPAGIGGTGFADNVWTAYTGTGFVQALARLRSTFNLIAANYPQHTPKLAGYLWHQGERDTDENISTGDYLNKDMLPMIKAWRDSNLLPQTNDQVPFVVGNLVPSWVEDPNQQQRLGVFAAIQLLDQYVPYTASTPSQGLQGDIQEGAGAIHFSAPSQRNFGKRYFAAWKLAQTNVPDQ